MDAREAYTARGAEVDYRNVKRDAAALQDGLPALEVDAAQPAVDAALDLDPVVPAFEDVGDRLLLNGGRGRVAGRHDGGLHLVA